MVKKIGFRRIELIQDDLPDGKTFYFRINGMMLYVIPCDTLHPKALTET